jgi:hypothetical protein
MLGAALRSVDVAAVTGLGSHAQHPFAAVALAAVVLAGASAVLLAVGLPETRPAARAPAAVSTAVGAVPRDAGALLWWLQTINVAYVTVFAGLEFLLAFMTAERFGYTDRANGQLLAYIGLVSAAVQGGLLRRLGARSDELAVAALGVCAMVAAHVGFAAATSTLALYAAATLYALASATVVSCLNATVSLLAPPHAVARVLGHMRAGGQLGRTLGPAVFASIFWARGATAAYLAGSVCGLLPLALLVGPVRAPWRRHRATLMSKSA